MKAINMNTKKKINPNDYENIHTGELLSSEHPNTTSVMVKIEDRVIISYDEYFTIDSNAFKYILTICSKADMEKILRMSDMVKGMYNILHDKNGSAHNHQTLRKSLQYDESEFSRFMKRLLSKSIICYLVGFKNNRKCRRIMLNPTLARKSKTFHKDCLIVFDNLSSKTNLLKDCANGLHQNIAA